MHRTHFTLAALVLASACGDDESKDVDVAVSIAFAASHGGAPFACGTDLVGVGTDAATVTPTDLRFYVHALRLHDANGDEVSVSLDETPFQHAGVALLDFEDGTAGCSNGTSELNTTVVGKVPAGEYDGLSFVIGVPFDLNHADPAVAASPLNLTALHWNWQGGYKFVRIDGDAQGSSAAADGFRFHLGSTMCNGDMAGNVTNCVNPNRPEIRLDSFVPERDSVLLDLGELFAGNAVTNNGGGAEGCMGSPDDNDCQPVFTRLGLPFSGSPAQQQTVFSAD